MNERIKQVRISNDKTQLEFASSLGLTRNYIAMIEIGQREPSDRTIADICRIFNINETWLRTGKGEMQVAVSRDAAINDFIEKVMDSEDTDFRKRLITVLSKLDSSEWKLLEKMALKLAAEEKLGLLQMEHYLPTFSENSQPALLSSTKTIPGTDGPVTVDFPDTDNAP